MAHNVAIDKAWKHGWRIFGVAFIGNASYTTLHRPGSNGKHVAVHPVTGRVFSFSK
jgi:hypothetical protein